MIQEEYMISICDDFVRNALLVNVVYKAGNYKEGQADRKSR